MSKNDNLNKAKKEDNDEFYTQMMDIEKELKHYKNHFLQKCFDCRIIYGKVKTLLLLSGGLLHVGKIYERI